MIKTKANKRTRRIMDSDNWRLVCALNAKMAAEGLSEYDVEAALERRPRQTTINRWRRNEVKTISASMAKRLRDYVRPYLSATSEDGEKLPAIGGGIAALPQDYPTGDQPQAPFRKIPVPAVAWCDRSGLAPSMSEAPTWNNYDGPFVWISDHRRGDLRGLRAGGNSMEPAIYEGDILIIDLNTDWTDCLENRECVVCYENDHGDEQLACKHLREHNGNYMLFESYKKGVPTLVLPVSRVKYVWRVVLRLPDSELRK